MKRLKHRLPLSPRKQLFAVKKLAKSVEVSVYKSPKKVLQDRVKEAKI